MDARLCVYRLVADADQRALLLELFRADVVDVRLVGDEAHVDAPHVLLHAVGGDPLSAMARNGCTERAQPVELHAHALLQQLGDTGCQSVQHVLHLGALGNKAVVNHVLRQATGAQHRGIEALPVELAALAGV